MIKHRNKPVWADKEDLKVRKRTKQICTIVSEVSSFVDNPVYIYNVEK